MRLYPIWVGDVNHTQKEVFPWQKKKKGQRADGLIEIARKMPSGKVRHFYGHSRAECEDKYRQALVCFSAQQAQEAAGPNYGRVRASRHSLLGQSAYSSGSQAN